MLPMPGRNMFRIEPAALNPASTSTLPTRLVTGRPNAFLPDLAISCETLGAVLVEMGRYGEAVDSFAEGIQALTPLLQQSPAAFAQLMRNLCGDYIQAVQQAQQQADMALLAPVMEVFEKLKPTPPKE
jgi:hypothetical protein